LIGKTDPSQQSIMVLGAGAMAESCVRLLVKKGARSIFVSNRSFDRALDLAPRGGGEAVCFGSSSKCAMSMLSSRRRAARRHC